MAGFEPDPGVEIPEVSCFETAFDGVNGKVESRAGVSLPASEGASDDNGEDGGAGRYKYLQRFSK